MFCEQAEGTERCIDPKIEEALSKKRGITDRTSESMTSITINTGAKLVGTLIKMDPVNGVTIKIAGVDVNIPMASITSIQEITEDSDVQEKANSKPAKDYESIIKSLKDRAMVLSEESAKIFQESRQLVIDYMEEHSISRLTLDNVNSYDRPQIIVSSDDFQSGDVDTFTKFTDDYYSICYGKEAPGDSLWFDGYLEVDYCSGDYVVDSLKSGMSASDMVKLADIVTSGKGEIEED